jgi:hypothetical protein
LHEPREEKEVLPPSSPFSYLEHSHPIMAFETPADRLPGTGYHSGSHNRCPVSHELHLQSHVGRSIWSSYVLLDMSKASAEA